MGACVHRLACYGERVVVADPYAPRRVIEPRYLGLVAPIPPKSLLLQAPSNEISIFDAVAPSPLLTRCLPLLQKPASLLRHIRNSPAVERYSECHLARRHSGPHQGLHARIDIEARIWIVGAGKQRSIEAGYGRARVIVVGHQINSIDVTGQGSRLQIGDLVWVGRHCDGELEISALYSGKVGESSTELRNQERKIRAVLDTFEIAWTTS